MTNKNKDIAMVVVDAYSMIPLTDEVFHFIRSRTDNPGEAMAVIKLLEIYMIAVYGVVEVEGFLKSSAINIAKERMDT